MTTSSIDQVQNLDAWAMRPEWLSLSKLQFVDVGEVES